MLGRWPGEELFLCSPASRPHNWKVFKGRLGSEQSEHAASSLPPGSKEQELDCSSPHETALWAVVGLWSNIRGGVATGTGNLVCSVGHKQGVCPVFQEWLYPGSNTLKWKELRMLVGMLSNG